MLLDCLTHSQTLMLIKEIEKPSKFHDQNNNKSKNDLGFFLFFTLFYFLHNLLSVFSERSSKHPFAVLFQSAV